MKSDIPVGLSDFFAQKEGLSDISSQKLTLYTKKTIKKETRPD